MALVWPKAHPLLAGGSNACKGGVCENLFCMKANVVGESRESPGLLPWICNTQLLSPSLQHKANTAGCLPQALPEQALPRYCTTQMTAGTGRNDDSSSKWKLASLEGFLWQLPECALKLLVVLGGSAGCRCPSVCSCVVSRLLLSLS